MVLENQLTFAIFDKYPVSNGHLLIIAKRHFSSYFEATSEERNAIWLLVEEGKSYLDSKYKPNGYNVGINVGEVSGQTIMHIHVHLIPRYIGDTENPTGGIRGAIPSKRIYKIEGDS